MAYLAPTDQEGWERGDRWYYSGSVSPGGVTSGLEILGDHLSETGIRHSDLLVDGMTVTYFRVGGGVYIQPRLGTFPLTSWTTAETIETRHFAPLDALIILGGQQAFVVSATTANGDTIFVTAWGRIHV